MLFGMFLHQDIITKLLSDEKIAEYFSKNVGSINFGKTAV